MKSYSFAELKGMETIDNGVDYSKFDNIINCNGFWVNGVVRSEIKTWSTSISICVRFFDKDGNNIAGVNLYSGQQFVFDEGSGCLEVHTLNKRYL